MKRLALLLIAFALALPLMRADAAYPTYTIEGQAWWAKDGIIVPTNVGQHIHLQATLPMPGTIVDGVVDVPVVIKLHNQTGKATSLRVSEGIVGVRYSRAISLGPCADCSLSLTVPIDFGAWTTGRDEMRWTVNIPSNSDGNRQYNSTGWQECVRSCSPTYRSGDFTEGRGWYTAHGYQNARLTSALASICSGCTIGVKLAPGSGGLATKFAGVYLDPDFHHGLAGIVVRTFTGAFTGSVTLPAVASGPHRLVLLSSDGNDAGVEALPFAVP